MRAAAALAVDALAMLAILSQLTSVKSSASTAWLTKQAQGAEAGDGEKSSAAAEAPSSEAPSVHIGSPGGCGLLRSCLLRVYYFCE